jgi:hypothetical protein
MIGEAERRGSRPSKDASGEALLMSRSRDLWGIMREEAETIVDGWRKTKGDVICPASIGDGARYRWRGHQLGQLHMQAPALRR